MDQPNNPPPWWDLHLRKASGETLSEQEQRLYDAEMARLARDAPPLQARAVAGDEAFPAINTLEWDAMNERRAELIRKDLDEGFTPAERDEYERLQRQSLAAAGKAFPRPKPDFKELAQLREELHASDTDQPVSGGCRGRE